MGRAEIITLGAGLALTGGTLSADASTLAPLDSPTFTGRPTAPTPPAGDISQALATTAFVAASSPTLTVVGDVVGTGSSPLTLVLPPIASPGTYTKVTVNGKGQVVSGGPLLAADIIAALGYTPGAGGGGAPGLAGADASAAVVFATATPAARSLAARAADRPSVLDFGADPTGGADSAPAFALAMAEVPNGATARLFVPRGTYRLGAFVNQPAGRSIGVELDEGAVLTGPGYLGVDRVDSHQGAYRLSQVSGGFTSQPSGVGAAGNPAFRLRDHHQHAAELGRGAHRLVTQLCQCQPLREIYRRHRLRRAEYLFLAPPDGQHVRLGPLGGDHQHHL